MTATRVLVTGGAGFVGSHLTERLLDGGHEVTVLDDLSTGRADNLDRVFDNPRLQIVHGSIDDRELVWSVVSDVDQVFHLAAVVGVRRWLDDPIAGYLTNVLGGANVIEAATRRMLPLLLTSSSEVYGRSPDLPWREDTDRVLGATTVPRWSYACAKAGEEMLALLHHRRSGAPVVVTRLFNVIGRRQVGTHGMVLPRFVEAAMRNQPLEVHGTGEQTRSFTGVADVTRALVELQNEPSAAGAVVNVGSSEETSILDLAQRVVRLANSQSPIELIPYERVWGPDFEDTPRRVPDTTLVNRLIGWSASTGLDALITQVIDDRMDTTSRRCND